MRLATRAEQFRARVAQEQQDRGCSFRQAWCWVQLDAVTSMDFVLRLDADQDQPTYEIDHEAWIGRCNRAAAALLALLESTHAN